MKKLVAYLTEKAKSEGFEWIFAKVHKDNLASQKSLLHNNFTIFSDYKKPVDINDFKLLSNQPFFSGIGKLNANKTLSKKTI